MTKNAQGSGPDLTVTPDIESRYGRTPGKARRDRLVAWLGGAAFVVVFGAWVVWVGLDGTSATIDTRDLGHKVIDDRSTRISFEVSATPGENVSCALQVQNEAHAIVGWKIVELPESERFTRTFTEVVRTTELGVTGLIYRCWLS